MRTVADLVAPDKQMDPAALEARVVSAYTNLFNGNGGKDDAEIVLIDLAQTSGYFEVLSADATPGELAQHNGSRTVFGRTMFATNMPQSVLNEMATALMSAPVATELEQ